MIILNTLNSSNGHHLACLMYIVLSRVFVLISSLSCILLNFISRTLLVVGRDNMFGLIVSCVLGFNEIACPRLDKNAYLIYFVRNMSTCGYDWCVSGVSSPLQKIFATDNGDKREDLPTHRDRHQRASLREGGL